MDRFLLAENPMRPNDGRLFVIHAINPVCIIECIEGKVSAKQFCQYFVYVNTDEVPEEWTLVLNYMSVDMEEKDKAHLLDRAWRWYRSYMNWEDKNIDTHD